MQGWVIAFVGTLLVETPIVALGLRRFVGARRAVALALLVNAITHPLAWWLTARVATWTVYATVELGVWIVESAVLTLGLRHLTGRWRAIDAVLIALVANATSAALGLWLFS